MAALGAGGGRREAAEVVAAVWAMAGSDGAVLPIEEASGDGGEEEGEPEGDEEHATPREGLDTEPEPGPVRAVGEVPRCAERLDVEGVVEGRFPSPDPEGAGPEADAAASRGVVVADPPECAGDPQKEERQRGRGEGAAEAAAVVGILEVQECVSCRGWGGSAARSSRQAAPGSGLEQTAEETAIPRTPPLPAAMRSGSVREEMPAIARWGI